MGSCTTPSQFWVHQFIHSLGQIPTTWYVHEEARCQTTCWEILQSQFCQDFLFSGKSPEITLALQQIKKMIFTDEVKPIHPPPYVLNMNTSFIISFTHPLHEYLLTCSKIDEDPRDPDDLET
jgi:hypothetical protein